MDMDHSVNSSLMVMHLIEEAMHRPDGWSLRCGQVEIPAIVIVGDHQLTLRGAFPEVPEWVALSRIVSIYRYGDLRWSREVADTQHGGFIVEWTWTWQSDSVRVDD